MKILILGSGGREHALAWKIKKSDSCDELFVAPGNAGTSQVAVNVDLSISDFATIGEFCIDNDIEMLIVGPEAPLVDGIYDFFAEDAYLKHIMVIGPSAKGAVLEGSKAYAKRFMQKYKIPTAGYQEFTKASLEKGIQFINNQKGDIVLKCDGLAAGKGVVILENRKAAIKELKSMLDGKFGGAGNTVVIEDFLDGIEFSVFVLTDGEDYKILPVAKDYKRIGEGDTGLNTGGMGAISPPPFVDEVLMEKVISRIVEPTVKGIKEENIDYKGIVFIGLIKVGEDPFVIEYNCRLGDPETEAILPRLETDLVDLFSALYDGNLSDIEIDINGKAAATVMLVSGGYPEAYAKNKEMSIPQQSDSFYFHAGTKSANGKTVTNGGRVLAITSMDSTFEKAVQTSLKEAEKINFEGKNYRKDIGFDL